MNKIISRSNPKIKQIRALKHRKHRQASGLFVVEGIHHVGEAAESRASIEYILYSPELLTNQFGTDLVSKLALEGIDCYQTDANIFKAVSNKQNPRGLMAVIRQGSATLADFDPESLSLGVALVAPQDPGNVGAISRTIDALGVDALLLLDGGVDIYHPTAVRASMGAMFWHPLLRGSFEEFATWVKEHGYHVYGSSAKRGETLDQDSKFEHPAILLLGSEREGLSDEYMALCERVFRLPMNGHVTSLNLAVSAGMLLYALMDD